MIDLTYFLLGALIGPFIGLLLARRLFKKEPPWVDVTKLKPVYKTYYTPTEILQAPKRVEEMGIEIDGGFFEWWTYSRSYVSTFEWKEIPPYSIRKEMEVKEFLDFVKENKDAIARVVFGSERHYGVCWHYAFVYFKEGPIYVIQFLPQNEQA